MSYFHFSRTFKRVAGESFNDFVQKAGIRKAGELLASPNVTITRVCFEVGFKEVSYFARVFRLVVGVSPTELRRMLAEPPAHALSATLPDRTYEAPRAALRVCEKIYCARDLALHPRRAKQGHSLALASRRCSESSCISTYTPVPALRRNATSLRSRRFFHKL